MIHALHGNLGAASDWEGISRDIPLVATDLWAWQEREPGLSLREFGGRWAAEVAGRDTRPILLGYSLGGRLGLHALAARPDLWRAAILISTHPGLETDAERGARLESDREWARRAREDDWPAFLDAWNGQPVLAGQPVEEERQRALESRREAVARGFESWSLGHQAAMGPEIAACVCPVLWVTGERDTRFSDLDAPVAVHSPAVVRAVVPGGGHRLLHEMPGAVSDLLGKFLQSRGLT